MGSAAAFFDLDRTLIRGSANFPLAVAAFRAGYVPPRALLLDAFSAVRFVLKGATDEGSAELRERILGAVAGHPAADVIALGDAFIPKLKAAVLPEARQLLADHAARGEDRVVVSASSEIDPAGRYTGRLAGPFCYKTGKVAEIQQLAGERGYDLGRCSAYSDSISDLPFLEAVGVPVAVNPDRELRRHASAHGWRVVEVARRRSPRLSQAAA